MNRWLASGYVLLGAICYGTTSTITKLALGQGFTPADISSGIATFGFLVLWTFALPLWKKLQYISWKSIFLITLAGSVWGITEIFYILCLSKLPASIAVILLFQFTWITQIVQMVQGRSWLSKERCFSLASIIFGTICASGFNMHDLQKLNTMGIILGLLSALSYTASMVVSGTLATNVPPLLRSSLSVTGQMLFLYLVFPPTFLFSTTIGKDFWLWIGLLGMISIVATTFAYNKGIPHIGAGLAGILGSAELPIVLLVSSALLKENISLAQWVGVGFIILGIIIASIKFNDINTSTPISPSEKI